MRCWIVSFGLGVLAGGWIPVLPAPSLTLLLWLPLLLSRWCRCLSLAAAFCLGLWWLFCLANVHQANLLPAALEQQDLWVTGRITGLPRTDAGSSRVVFRVSTLCRDRDGQDCLGQRPYAPRKILLNDYTGLTFTPGEHWQLLVRLKRPHGFANPGGFDYERWLFQEGISATGYIRVAAGPAAPGLTPAGLVNRWRLHQLQWLDALPLASTGFIAALTIGERAGISDRQWQLLTLTGTNHLLVISGLHIGLVAWLVYRVASAIVCQCPACCRAMPAGRVAALAAIMAAVLYSAIAGFSLPVQRALVMVCCLMSGQVLVRQTLPMNNLCLALLGVLLLDPLAPHSAGFWLSFTAVALLLMSLPKPADAITQRPAPALALLRTQYTLFLGLAPVMLVLFRQVSLLAPLVNIVAIPFVGLLVVPLCLLALCIAMVAPPLAAHVVRLPDVLLVCFERVLAWLTGHLPGFLARFPALPAWLVFLLALVLMLHLWRPRALSWTALVATVLLAYWYPAERPHPGTFDLDVLDVGQGQAVVVTTARHVLLYDTGPAYSPRFNAGAGIILPFLGAMNLGIPDLVVVSHGDSDHAGGLGALQAAWPDASYLAGEPVPGALQQPVPCHAGQAWNWDGVQFSILHPETAGLTGNDVSCVLRVTAGEYSVLLPGDIEAEVELALVRRYRRDLRADLLVAPHHGSGTSSTSLFLRMVDPDHVIFTTGYLNRFDHPDATVRARYRNQGSTAHNTADTGAIRVHVAADTGVAPLRYYRETRPRFWSTRR